MPPLPDQIQQRPGHPRVPPRVAIATSVFTLAIVAAAGAAIHALHAQPVWHVVGWSIPGVLIGSTIGSRLGKYLPAAIMEKALGVVFAGVGLLVLRWSIWCSLRTLALAQAPKEVPWSR